MNQNHIKNKKLNIILPGLGDSGGIQVIKKYKELLEADGWNVVIYCPIKAYNLHRYNSNLKNIIHQIYCTLKTLVEIYRKPFYKWIWKVSNHTIRNADFTMATLWASAFDVVKLSNSKGKKYYFIQGYEIWDNKNLAKKSYILPLNKIVISSWINEKLKNDLGIGPFPIVYNGIDISIYHTNPFKKKSSEIQFLMLNHGLPKKGVDNGLRAYEQVVKKHKNCKLRMFGMCNASNLPGYVEYYQNPSKDKIVELYSTSDIFIFPSLEEGWGLTPIEAMACGCVVAGTSTGFVLDLGIHGENMLISNSGDIGGMVRNIEGLINDKNKMNQIAQNGLSTVRKLQWENSVKVLEDIFLCS